MSQYIPFNYLQAHNFTTHSDKFDKCQINPDLNDTPFKSVRADVCIVTHGLT